MSPHPGPAASGGRPRFATLIALVRPERVAGLARRHENDGWDGVWCIDSQNIAGDVYVNLAMVAQATSRVEFGPWVTNPVTRHPAVAASAIATLDTLSGGRAMLGIGRGDSALANLGAAPASIPEFDLYLGALQSYLSGEGVPFALSQRWLGPTRPVSEIPLGEAHDDSRLSWRQPGERTVPVDVVATGPRMIALGAQRSTRVTLAVGADLDRLRWAREVARQGRLEAGLDPDDLSLGVALSVVALDDVAAARARCAPSVASQARFSTMHGKPIGPVSDADRQVLEAVSAAYDMRFHGGPGAQIRALTDDFIDRFAVVGPPGRCVERLQEIAALGFDRVTVYLSGDALEPDDDKAYQALVESVIPHV